MTIHQIKPKAAEMGVPVKEAIFYRLRYVREQMLAECEHREYPDPVTEAVSEALSLNRFCELAHEQRRLALALKPHPQRADQITDEMVELARSYPIDQLVDFQRGKSRAWCHEDANPSLYLARRINKAACPVCCRYFDSIAVLVDRDGLTFPEAVRRLAA